MASIATPIKTSSANSSPLPLVGTSPNSVHRMGASDVRSVNPRKSTYDAQEVKRHLNGRWQIVLNRAAGIPLEQLDGIKKHNCIKCGGSFRFTNMNGDGSAVCAGCLDGAGDGFAVLMHYAGCDFPSAVRMSADISNFQPGEGVSRTSRPADECGPETDGLDGETNVDPGKDIRFTSPMMWAARRGPVWERTKPGCTIAAVKLAGGRAAEYSIKNIPVIAFPVRGPKLFQGDPTGYIVWATDPKQPLMEFEEGKPVKELRVKTTKGTVHGLVNDHALAILDSPSKRDAVVSITFTEGPSDLNALISIMPEAERESHLVLTNSNGCVEPAHDWVIDIALGCPNLQFINIVRDCDIPGRKSAAKWCKAFSARVHRDGRSVVVRDVRLPFEVVKSHGKDLRDWVVTPKDVPFDCDRDFSGFLKMADEAGAWSDSEIDNAHEPDELGVDVEEACTFPEKSSDSEVCNSRQDMGSPGLTNFTSVPKSSRSKNATPVPTQAAIRGANCGDLSKIDPGYLDKEANRTDLGNARLFRDIHGENVRYCHKWNRWLIWNGIRWQIDESGLSTQLAVSVVDSLWFIACNDVQRRHAYNSASSGSLRAMLGIAKDLSGIPVSPEELDCDNWLLTCPNGTLDLRTGKLHPHNRSNLITKLCPTPFDPEASCPDFQRFMAAIFNDKDAIVQFMQKYFGYCLTGDVREQILLILSGGGANGKTTLLNVFMRMLGDDHCLKSVADLLLKKKHDSHPTERADLFRKRFVACVETNKGQRFDESMVKELTGGDKIRARRMREDFWEFSPTHKIGLCTNDNPRVSAGDHGFWRRTRLIEFKVTFWEAAKGGSGEEHLKADPLLTEKLMAEASGILAWCVEGCKAWQSEGLNVPEEINKATEEYKASQDSVSRFLDERCQFGISEKCQAAYLYKGYLEWSRGIGEHPMSNTAFGKRMSELEKKYEFSKKKEGVNFYMGVSMMT